MYALLFFDVIRSLKYLIQVSAKYSNLNEMWNAWRHFPIIMSVTDKHAPLKTKRTRNNGTLWITNELLREIYKTVYLTKPNAIIPRRNCTQVNLTHVKHGRLINELQSCQCKSTNVTQINLRH